MDEQCISRLITLKVVRQLFEKTNKRYIPTAGSNRHVHLSREDIDKLFGDGYELEVFKLLSQPGQYAAKEKVDIVGPKGTIKGVRILGPARKLSQVEIFYGDSYKLGIKPVIKMSGDISGTPGAKITGPKGEVVLSQGVIVAARHLHISPEESEWFGLENGDIISVRKTGDRALVIENIPVRCGEGHSLEIHLDIEEANAGMIKNGDLLELVNIIRG